VIEMPPKKKGLSFDQKKEVLGDALLASSTIHNMKELEALGRKHKVISQAIPEVVEALISEKVMCLEKVGTQNIYWAFPSMNKARLLSDKASLESELIEANLRKSAAEVKRDDCLKRVIMSHEAREKIVTDIKRMRIRVDEYKVKLAELRKSDPEFTRMKIRQLKTAKASCDLWTDNIFILKQRVMERFHCSEEDIHSQFGIPIDLDFI
jgi:hypothetical protein